jgi:polysaccharide export outer membrane protein
VDQYAPARTPPSGYVIGVGDVLSIEVFDQPKMAARERVRPDGKMSMPLLGEFTAVDKAPAALAKELEKTLKDRSLVVDPRVAVHVDEIKPLAVSVLGKVARPGAFTIEPGAGVAQALASAGGLTDFADKTEIYLVRSTTPAVRLRFTFDQLTGRSATASQFKLKNGDVIVVY